MIFEVGDLLEKNRCCYVSPVQVRERRGKWTKSIRIKPNMK
jgi:hypothetical protein